MQFGGVQLEDGDINRNSQESSSAETRVSYLDYVR